jgi:hypothetical protein
MTNVHVAMTAAVLRKVVAGLCFIGAAYVAHSGNDGWGWLIFAGIIVA